MGRPWRVYPWEIEIGRFENVLRRHNDIVPREARNSFRTIEICKAIINQVERGVAIPNEWKEELDTLI